MYSDRVEIISPGALYGGIKLEKLGTPINMETRNPTIVRILEEKSSVIENRYTGINTMKNEMASYGLPEPEFYDDGTCFKVIFRNDYEINQCDTQSGQQDGPQSGQQTLVEEYKAKVLEYCKEPRYAKEIKEYLHIKSRQYISTNIIKPLINAGKLEYTNKNSVNAKNQRYVTKK